MRNISSILTSILFIIGLGFSSSVYSMCTPTYSSTANALCTSPVITQDGACVGGTNVGLTACLSGSCANAQDQDFMQFTATSTGVFIDFTSTGINTADLLVLTNGTGGCGDHVSNCPALGSLCIESCNTSVGGGPLQVNPTNLIIGETYYLMVESSNANSGTFNICVSTDPCFNGIQDGTETAIDCGGATCNSCPPPAPPNNLCANAITLPCGTLNMTGTTDGATNIVDGTGCTIADYGVWYTFVGDGNSNTITVDPESGYDVEIGIATGSCGSLTNVSCTDNSTGFEGVVFTAALGVTYYVYIAEWISTGTATGDFKISRACADNDACASAATLSCGSTIFGSTFGTTSAAHGTGCTMGDEGAWYTFVGDGNVTTIYARTISGWDFEMAITSGTCGSQTNVTCEDNLIVGYYETYTFTATSGVTYFIYISDWSATNNTEGDFSISRTCGTCGNPANNDYCSDPATLFQGGAGWSSSTTDTYTPDVPANTTNLFCGSVENNSWYEFTATATTETFDFTNIVNCAAGLGVQAEVFDVTKDANGCCTSLSSVSNCMSPGTPTPATVTASGLTIGNSYILMVDGWGGDQCDFTVTGWTAINILPVELIYFEGHKVGDITKLTWATLTEINNDYFLVQKSSNAKNFIDLGIVDGNGSSNVQNNYEFYDETSSPEISYYRLKQFDFDGKYEYSEIIAIVTISDDIDVKVYPNPSKDDLFMDLSNVSDQTIIAKYTNVLGSTISEKINIESGKSTYRLGGFKSLKPGFYIVQILDENQNLIKSERIVKQ